MIFSTSSSSRTRPVWALLTLLTALLLPNCALWKGRPGESFEAGSRLPESAAGSEANLIAVLPVDNLTGTSVPLETIEAALRAQLDRRGFRIVDDRTLARAMKRYRVRNTGGVDSRISGALQEETGAAGVLITSLESFSEDRSPRFSLLSRLVVGGDHPEIAWMDGIGMAGDAYPGLLELGQIGEIDDLVELATRCLVDSLAISFLETRAPASSGSSSEITRCDSRGEVVYSSAEAKGEQRFHPRHIFGSPIADVDRRYGVAVIPFLNLSQTKNAGKIVELHFVNQLLRNASLAVAEPGLVREELLEHRVVMEAGPSLENAEVLSNDESLGVDLVLSGVVFDYQDGAGDPKVDFSVTMIDKQNHKVVWSSRSRSTGEEGVSFFDLGRVYTAHQLVSEMARGTSEALSR